MTTDSMTRSEIDLITTGPIATREEMLEWAANRSDDCGRAARSCLRLEAKLSWWELTLIMRELSEVERAAVEAEREACANVDPDADEG